MEITPNDINRTQGQLATVDPKIAQLIKNFVNRPLLLEKLIINQSQGLLLGVTNQTNRLDLQLPIKLSSLFENVSQIKPQLSITITANQKIIINLTIPQPTSPTDLKTTAPPPPNSQPRPILLDNSVLPSSSHRPQVLQFKIAQLLPNQVLKLTEIDQASKKQIDSLITAKNVDSTSFTQSKNLSPAAIETSKTSLATSVSAAASQILSRHFSKQSPVANHLARVKLILGELKAIQMPSPAVSKLTRQVQDLLNSLKISTLPTGENIKQRIINSGNLLENKASQKLVANSAAKDDISASSVLPNKSRDDAYIPASLRHFVKSDHKNSDSTSENTKLQTETGVKIPTKSNVPKDLKLQLMQIRATLEALIKNSLGKPVQTNVSSTSRDVSTPANTNQITNPVSFQSGTQSSPQSSTKSGSPLPNLQHNIGQINRAATTKSTSALAQQNIIFKQSNELLTEVRSVISQIENNQLHSLRTEQPNLQQFLVDLPFGNEPDIDSFELLFENEHDEAKLNVQKVKSWKVVVRFDLEPLGAMFAQVELVNERLSTHIFAKSQQTAVLINEHMHVLKKSLFAAGVDVDELKASQGNVPEKLIKDDPNQVDVHV